MEKVLGFGGLFFRAKQPSKLAQWYHENLGIDPVPKDPGATPWVATGGPTVFAPFSEGTDYFSADKSFMVNFRVRDLSLIVAQLESNGIDVQLLDDVPGIGKFAHLSDPEGNAIELWEPQDSDG